MLILGVILIDGVTDILGVTDGVTLGVIDGVTDILGVDDGVIDILGVTDGVALILGVGEGEVWTQKGLIPLHPNNLIVLGIIVSTATFCS